MVLNQICSIFQISNWITLEYAMKKERLLLENRKTIDKGTLIDLIATGLPSYVTNELDRELLEKLKIYILGKLQHLIRQKKFDEKGQLYYKNNYTKEKTEKTMQNMRKQK